MKIGPYVFQIEHVSFAYISRGGDLRIVLTDQNSGVISVNGKPEELNEHLTKIEQALEALDAVAMVPWKPSPWFPYQTQVTSTGSPGT